MANVDLKSLFTSEKQYTVLQLLNAMIDEADKGLVKDATLTQNVSEGKLTLTIKFNDDSSISATTALNSLTDDEKTFLSKVISNVTATSDGLTFLKVVGFEGNETHKGNEIHQGYASFLGDEAHAGTETHKGNETHSGVQTYNGKETHNADITFYGDTYFKSTEQHFTNEYHMGLEEHNGNVGFVSDVLIGGTTTHNGVIKTSEIDNLDGNAMVRNKDTEGVIAFGTSAKKALIMGSGDRPTYSKDGSDFSGEELALKSDCKTRYKHDVVLHLWSSDGDFDSPAFIAFSFISDKAEPMSYDYTTTTNRFNDVISRLYHDYGVQSPVNITRLITNTTVTDIWDAVMSGAMQIYCENDYTLDIFSYTEIDDFLPHTYTYYTSNMIIAATYDTVQAV